MKDTTECKKGQKKTVQYVICNAHCNSDHIYKPVLHELDIATQCTLCRRNSNKNEKCFQSRNATVLKLLLTQSSKNTERLRNGPRRDNFSISFPSALDNGDGIQTGKVTI